MYPQSMANNTRIIKKEPSDMCHLFIKFCLLAEWQSQLSRCWKSPSGWNEKDGLGS
jgi:hypothetical protein